MTLFINEEMSPEDWATGTMMNNENCKHVGKSKQIL